MRAHQHAEPLVVVRSEAESGRVGLRLIGELDLNTVDLLQAELTRASAQALPSVIDLSELRFLDLVGLRALLRAVESDAASTPRLVGATGIVRRLIELSSTLDAESAGATQAPSPCEPTTRFAAVHQDAPASSGAGNGNGAGNGRGKAARNGAAA